MSAMPRNIRIMRDRRVWFPGRATDSLDMELYASLFVLLPLHVWWSGGQ